MNIRVVLLVLGLMVITTVVAVRVNHLSETQATCQANNTKVTAERDEQKKQLDLLSQRRLAEPIEKRFELVYGFGLPLTHKEAPVVYLDTLEYLDVLQTRVDDIEGEIRFSQKHNAPSEEETKYLNDLRVDLAQAKKRHENALAVYNEAKAAGLFFNKK